MVEYAVPNEIAGKYEIRGTLGSGAMGTVFDGFDRLIERRVAIKVVRLPPAGDPESDEARGRFRREAQAAGRLSHPAIVGVYDYGENAETAWIVMELVEGGSLKEPLDRGERMPLPEIVRVMEEALGALAYSHGRGVVHRDIKPANIMVAADKSVKIADFGIARLENSSMTQVGTVMGTPSYMSPEQLRGEPADLRTDIWAAGVMLYQLLTGEKPFEGGFSAVMHKALNTEPTPPSTLSVTAPRAFDAVISRALAKRPEDRYGSALEFAQAIRAAAQAPDNSTGDRFAGAGPLPGLDDATMVSTGTRHPAPPPAPSPSPVVPAPAPPAGKSRTPLLAGVAAVVLLAGGGAAWWFTQGGGDAPPPTPGPSVPTTGPVPAPPTPSPPGPVLPPTTQPLPSPPTQPAPTPPTQTTPAPSLPSPPSQPVPSTPAPGPLPAPQTTPGLPPTQPIPTPTPLPTPSLPPAQPTPAPQTTPSLPPAQPIPTPTPLPQTSPAQPVPIPTPPRPLPTPQPQAPAAPSRAEITAAARNAVAAAPCALLTTAVDDRGATITGVLRRGGEAAMRDALARSGLPADTVRLRVQPFDGPYCELLDALRPLTAAPELGPQQLDLADPAPLPRNALIRLNMTMPAVPSQLHLTYVTSGGDAAQLVSAEPQAAGARVRKGDRAPGFSGWEVDEPFGTDLLLAFTSDRPLFAQPRPVVEPLSTWLPALEAALRRIRQEGGRVGVRPLAVDTVAQR
ncbi:serine/threonine-protein kinase [Roseomonas sp. BN140053]|uniref:serine/threonine-protein kinase n=1 Tax=Roseomonas sp. BN140053 TaxID=3391898 RepID=UPI0039E91085